MTFLRYFRSYRERLMSVLRGRRVHNFQNIISKGLASSSPSHGCPSYVATHPYVRLVVAVCGKHIFSWIHTRSNFAMLLLVLPVSDWEEPEISSNPHVIVHYRHITTDNGLVCFKLKFLFTKLSAIQNDFTYGTTSLSLLPNPELKHVQTYIHIITYKLT